jgi:hypothetical protein
MTVILVRDSDTDVYTGEVMRRYRKETLSIGHNLEEILSLLPLERLNSANT